MQQDNSISGSNAIHQREEASSTIQSRGSRSDPRSNGQINRYRRHTVLLIHDSNFDKFNPRSFISQFNIHQFGVSSLENLEKKRKQLNEKNKKASTRLYLHSPRHQRPNKEKVYSIRLHPRPGRPPPGILQSADMLLFPYPDVQRQKYESTDHCCE